MDCRAMFGIGLITASFWTVLSSHPTRNQLLVCLILFAAFMVTFLLPERKTAPVEAGLPLDEELLEIVRDCQGKASSQVIHQEVERRRQRPIQLAALDERLQLFHERGWVTIAWRSLDSDRENVQRIWVITPDGMRVLQQGS